MHTLLVVYMYILKCVVSKCCIFKYLSNQDSQWVVQPNSVSLHKQANLIIKPTPKQFLNQLHASQLVSWNHFCPQCEYVCACVRPQGY